MGAVSKVTDTLGLTDSEAGDRGLSAQRDAMGAANRMQREQYDDSKERYAGAIERGDEAFGTLADLAEDDNRFTERDFTESNRFSRAGDPMRESTGRFTMKDFLEDPGYQFRLAEGSKAIERSAAARGRGGSGAALKDLTRFGQNLASEEYGKARGRFQEDYRDSYNRFNLDRSRAKGEFEGNQDRQFGRLNTIAQYGAGAMGTLSGAGSNYANTVGSNMMGLGNAEAGVEMGRHGRSGMATLYDMGMQGAGIAYGSGGGGGGGSAMSKN